MSSPQARYKSHALGLVQLILKTSPTAYSIKKRLVFLSQLATYWSARFLTSSALSTGSVPVLFFLRPKSNASGSTLCNFMKIENQIPKAIYDLSV